MDLEFEIKKIKTIEGNGSIKPTIEYRVYRKGLPVGKLILKNEYSDKRLQKKLMTLHNKLIK